MTPTSFGLEISPALLAPVFSKWLRAYMECSDVIQADIRDLLDCLDEPDVDEDDRQAAIDTIVYALFPPVESELSLEEMEAEDRKDPEKRKILEELDAEEAYFSDRVKAIMQQKQMTQCELAKLIGTNQSSISNMLNRQSRPQQRTVGRIAEALGVSPLDLWPK